MGREEECGQPSSCTWDWGCAMQDTGFAEEESSGDGALGCSCGALKGSLMAASPTAETAQPALCWLQGLQLVPSLVAHSLPVLRASWDTATAEGTWLCHALS